MINLVVSCS